MTGIVPTAVTGVDAANERDVPRRVITMADDEGFLVVGAEHTYPLI